MTIGSKRKSGDDVISMIIGEAIELFPIPTNYESILQYVTAMYEIYKDAPLLGIYIRVYSFDMYHAALIRFPKLLKKSYGFVE